MTLRSASRRRALRQLSLLIGANSVASVAPAAAPQADSSIVLGHTYPATGIFADTAAEMKVAIDAAVAQANAQGGVQGRRLSVVSLDDGYDPKRTLENATRLADTHHAVALIAPLGAPNLAALIPFSQSRQIPVIGARSGADISQRAVAAAKLHGLELTHRAVFDIGGSDASAVAAALVASKPQVLLVAGGGRGAAAVVKAAIAAGLPAASIYCLSLLQPAQIDRELGTAATGIVFTQVMPSPDHATLALSVNYRNALRSVPGGGAKPTVFGLEAYASVQLALRATPTPTGSC